MLTPHLIFLFIIQNHFSLFVLTVVAPDELFPGTVCVCLCVCGLHLTDLWPLVGLDLFRFTFYPPDNAATRNQRKHFELLLCLT